MIGTKLRAFSPLGDRSLESLVPTDHFYRRLERALDLSFVHDLVVDCYAAGGRPSVDPVVFFKLQLVMLFEGIRSERQLMQIVADRLSVRWYLGYDLDETLPDHSSLTRIRDRYGLDIFRRFFDVIVEQCIAAGLVWGKELFFDASKVEANASPDSMMPRFAVEAHLAQRFCQASDDTEGSEEEIPLSLPIALPQGTYYELAVANAARHDWIAKRGAQQRDVVSKDYHRISDRKASRTDPDATLMRTKSNAHPGYHMHYAIDGGKARIILSALVTPAEVMENTPMLDLLWHARFRWHLSPHHVTGDTKYGTWHNIAAVEREGIRAYVPLKDYETRSPYFPRSRFSDDAERDAYICPQGESLRRVGSFRDIRVVRYIGWPKVCNACPVKDQCTPGKSGRKIERSFDEEYVEQVRGYHQTEGYKKAMRKRQVWIEPLFAEAKAWHGLRRFRLRRLPKVNIEMLVASTQNIKRLLNRERFQRPPRSDDMVGRTFRAILTAWMTAPEATIQAQHRGAINIRRIYHPVFQRPARFCGATKSFTMLRSSVPAARLPRP